MRGLSFQGSSTSSSVCGKTCPLVPRIDDDLPHHVSSSLDREMRLAPVGSEPLGRPPLRIGRRLWGEGAYGLMTTTSLQKGLRRVCPDFGPSDEQPEVTERKEGDECLLLASNGLWDVVSNEGACGIARTCLRNSTATAGDDATEGDNCSGGSNTGCSNATVLLTKLALAWHSSNNVSVVIIYLRRL
ncbi:protein phosphatase 2C 77-like [Musa acuminata AAA Group]|uniref:protein phosphatase 2C 77-like n=1 Tax=Musa acuminata AAA Group TaxID=214697 RepID=UPI0031D1B1F5